MKNDANIRNFIEIPGNLHGKSGNFRGIHSSKWQKRRKILRSFPVISGRFRSFLQSFPVIPGYDSAKSFLFIPFYSSSSSNHPDFML